MCPRLIVLAKPLLHNKFSIMKFGNYFDSAADFEFAEKRKKLNRGARDGDGPSQKKSEKQREKARNAARNRKYGVA